MSITIQFRRGTLSQWTGANPILASGEPGLDLTNMLLKVGDGSRNWNNLPYVSVRLSGGTGIGLSQNPDGSYTISSPLSISGIGLSRTYNNSPSGNYTLSLSTGLQSIANLNIPTNNYLYTTGPNTFSTGLITSAGRSLLASNGHTHSVSDISNFGSGVSGLLPTGTVGYIPKFGNGGSGLNNSIIIQSGNLIGIGINPQYPYTLNINDQFKASYATLDSVTIGNPAHSTFTDEGFIFIHSCGMDIDTEYRYANFYNKLFIDDNNPIVNISGDLNINGTGVSLSGHTHGLKIGDGSADQISYLSSDRLNVVGTGGTSISFDDSSNTITISGAANLTNVVFTTGNQNISGIKTFFNNVISSGQISAPTGRFDYITSDKDFTINGTMNINAAASILANGPIIFKADKYVVSGAGYFTSGLFVGPTGSETPVSLSGHNHLTSDITNFGSGVSGLFPSTLVYTTGNQSVSGIKTFLNDIIVTGQILAVSGYFKNLISINGTGVSLSGHNHVVSDISNFGSGVSGLIIGSGNYLTKFNNSNSGITNSIIYESGSKIGIGTITPSGQLHIIGTGLFSSRVGINTNTPNESLEVAGNISQTWTGSDTRFAMVYDNNYRMGINFAASQRIMNIFSTSSENNNGHIIFSTRSSGGSSTTDYGSERMRITGSGYVGIGTSSPSGQLHVNGSGIFTSGLFVTGLLTCNSGSFNNSLQLNGTGVSISGHSHTISNITNFGSGVSGLLPINLVYTTGNQTISGVKTFLDNVVSSGQISSPSGKFDYIVSDKDFIINGTLNINAAASILASGPVTFVANPYVVSGAGYFTSGLFVGPTGNATPVSVSGHRQPYSTIDNFCTGVAECVNTPLLAGTGITLSYVNGTGLYINASGGIQISSSSSGFVVKTGINNYTTRYISNGSNINISYADGVSGNPTISLSGNLDLIQNITSTGNLRANSGIFTSGITLNGTGVVLTNRKINTSSGIGGGSDLSSDITIGLTGLAYNLSNINSSGFIATTGNNGVVTRTISASGLNILIGSGNGVGGNPIIGLNPYTSGLNTLQSSYLYSNSGYFNSLLQVNGTGIFSSGIGVGINTPLDLIHVSGSSANAQGIRIDNGDGQGGSIQADNGALYFKSPTATAFRVQAAKIRLGDGTSSTAIELTSNGSISQDGNGGGLTFSGTTAQFSNGINVTNSGIFGSVGIGTTAPQELLHVSGTISSSAGNLLRLNNSSATTNPSINFRIGGVGNYDSHFFISRNGTDVFGIDTNNRGVFLNSFSLFGNQSFSSYNNANAFIKLQNTTTNDLEISAVSGILFQSSQSTKMRMDQSGNFGIGTTAPSKKLDVIGDARVSGVLNLVNISDSTDRSISVTSNNMTFANVHGIFDYSIGLRGSRGSACGMESNATNGYLALAAGGSEKVRIATDGKVGIGTTNPSGQLHVVGSGFFSSGLAVIGLITSNSGNFIDSLQVNGTGVSLIGHNHSASNISDFNSSVSGLLPSNIVYTTGDQSIGGIKTFTSGFASNLSSNFYLNNSFNNSFKINYGTSSSPYGTISIIPSGTNPGTTNIVSQFNGTNTIYLPSSNGNLALVSDINTSQITGIVSVTKGGTNTSTYSNGQLLIGSGTSLAANTLSAGTGISITNGSGTITINTSGLQALLTNPVTGTGTGNSISGYLPRWNNNNQLSNSIIYQTGNNIGIGTATPSEALQVVGNIICNNIIPNDPLNTPLRVGSPAAYLDVGDNVFIYGEGEVVLRYSINNGGIVRIVDIDSNTSTLTATNNNIGIGTDSPSAKLHIAGDVLATGSFIAGSGSAANPSFEFTGDPDTGLFSPSGNIIGFASSGLERLRIDNIGNVGIGTSSPNGRLHINGTGLVDGRLSVSPTTAVTSPLSVVHISGSVTDNASLMISGPTVTRTYLGIGNSDTTPFFASLNGDISASTYGWGFFDRGSNGFLNIQRKGGVSSWSSVMTMDRTNGNVGIGTGVQATTPPEKLTVDGTIRLSDTAGNRFQFYRGGGTVYDYSMSKESNHLAISTAYDSTTQRYTQFGYHASNGTWNPKTVINGYTGAIGINTTTPSGYLDVAGDIFVRGTGGTAGRINFKSSTFADTILNVRSDANGNIYMDGGGVTVKCGSQDGQLALNGYSTNVQIGHTYNAGTIAQHLRFTPGSSELMRMTNSGTIGIGLPLTNSLFNIQPFDNCRLHIMGSGANSSSSALNVANSGNSSLLFVRNDGNIGIRTNTPAAQLHINGSGIVSSGLSVSGSLSLNGSAVDLYDTSILSLGTISGSNAINCGQDRSIQTLTLNGAATTFTKGSGWPSTDNINRDVTLNITTNTNTSITWSIINDWYRQPDSPLPSGKHIVLLRGIGSGIIEGHYIGSKSN
jgi:hypothetical protein